MKIEIDLHCSMADRIIVAALKEQLDDIDFWKDEPEYYEKLKTGLEVVLEHFDPGCEPYEIW